MLGDLRVIFLTAESAPSVARFRVVLSELGYGLVENCSEWNSHFGWRWVGRMNAPAQDIGGGGKLWDAMRRAGSCVTQEIAFWYGSVMAYIDVV